MHTVEKRESARDNSALIIVTSCRRNPRACAQSLEFTQEANKRFTHEIGASAQNQPLKLSNIALQGVEIH